MKPWNVETAWALANSSPRGGAPAVWRVDRQTIVATDGCWLMARPGTGRAPPPHSAAADHINLFYSRPMRRGFIATPAFRDWLKARAAEKVTECGAIPIHICGRRFDARLVHHVVKLAPDGARVALEIGKLSPLHVVATDFRACVMPMVKDALDPLKWATRRSWPRRSP